MNQLSLDFLSSDILNLEEWLDKARINNILYLEADTIIFLDTFNPEDDTLNVSVLNCSFEYINQNFLEMVAFCDENFSNKYIFKNHVICCRCPEDLLLFNLRFK